MSETGAEWDFIKERGPRCGVDVAGPTFLRLAFRDVAEGRRDSGAAGASDFFEDQKPRE